jgi:2-polyprenyl-3-methyl-5-hydroxy-6-metoxy-1,4-benzoquinol methylase
MMIRPLLNDVAQRVLTLNKKEQKEHLSRILYRLKIDPGSKILDFGCGTGLFAKFLVDLGFLYHGYDVDQEAINYASRLYGDLGCTFSVSLDEVSHVGPFDLVLVNCCLHHIDDRTISEILSRLENLILPGCILLVIDIELLDSTASRLRKLYMKLERGAYVRSASDYKSLIERRFEIASIEIEKCNLFSLKNSPIFNNLVVITSRKDHKQTAWLPFLEK